MYHPGTDYCWQALDQGPCAENQWLAPSNLTTGEVDIYDIYNIYNIYNIHDIYNIYIIYNTYNNLPYHIYNIYDIYRWSAS